MTMATDKPVDMKLSKKDRDKMYGGPTVAGKVDGPKYPWGLEVRLDKVSLEKLGLTGDLPEVGALCQITAVGRVISVSERQNQSGKDCDATIQIERMTLATEDDDKAERDFERGAKKGRGRAGY
jgi:hypothetical protein